MVKSDQFRNTRQGRNQSVTKMVKIQRTWFFLLLSVICCSASESNKNSNLPNFDEIKHAFFNLNRNELNFESLSPNDEECVTELSTIGKGLMKGDLWAMKSEFLFHFFSMNKMFNRIGWLFTFSSRCMGKNSIGYFWRKPAIFWFIFWMLPHWTQ